MALAVLAPEYITGIAFTEVRTVLQFTSRMKSLEHTEWTAKQSFYVAMGGYMLQREGKIFPISVNQFLDFLTEGLMIVEKPASAIFNITIELPEESKPVDEEDKKATQIVEEHVSPVRNESQHLPLLLPWMSSHMLDNMTKADYFLKAVTVMQICWFLVQCIGRTIQHLGLSPLEVTTMAYIFCALLSYICWWKKPYDLFTPTIVPIDPLSSISLAIGTDPPQCIRFGHDPDMQTARALDFGYILATEIMLLGFSCLHFAAWNYTFQTYQEQQLWRWLTVVNVGLHVIMIGVALLFPTRTSTPKTKDLCIASWVAFYITYIRPCLPSTRFVKRLERLLGLDAEMKDIDPPTPPLRFAVMFLTLLYCIMRLYCLVESFVGPRSVPKSVYVTVDWVKMLPHL